MIRVLLFLLALAGPAQAENVVVGLSQDRVGITAFFDGSKIFVYGAIDRQAPSEGPLDVVVTIAGPTEPVLVRRKEKRFGIWVNADVVEVDAAPTFYAVASSALLKDVLLDTVDLRHGISLPQMIRSVGAPMDISDTGSFTQALIRIREKQGLYRKLEGGVRVQGNTLFEATVGLPANLTEGTYPTRVFLLRHGDVVAQKETQIVVQKIGLERWLYRLAHDQPLLYGLLSLAIAITAGWGAAAAFRAIRGV